MVGVENDPKPCAATDPVPELNEPLGFCSPNELPPKLKPFAPLFPNRLDGPARNKPHKNLSTNAYETDEIISGAQNTEPSFRD